MAVVGACRVPKSMTEAVAEKLMRTTFSIMMLALTVTALNWPVRCKVLKTVRGFIKLTIPSWVPKFKIQIKSFLPICWQAVLITRSPMRQIHKIWTCSNSSHQSKPPFRLTCPRVSQGPIIRQKSPIWQPCFSTNSLRVLWKKLRQTQNTSKEVKVIAFSTI